MFWRQGRVYCPHLRCEEIRIGDLGGSYAGVVAWRCERPEEPVHPGPRESLVELCRRCSHNQWHLRS